VTIAQDILVVGAPYTMAPTVAGAMEASLFTLRQQQGPTHLLEVDQFGFSIALDVSANPSTNVQETCIAIGARFDDDKGQDSGSIYMYRKI